MPHKILFSTVLLFFIILPSLIAQEKETIHHKINKDIYINFSKAYDSLDYNLFASIHSSDMIRISGNGGEIKNVKTYLEGYKKRWNDPNRKPASINFRIFERILSDSLTSDRGIYRVTYTTDKGKAKDSYGKFHVLLKLENDSWRIVIDYDSNENKTINKQSYESAYAISQYPMYCKNKK